MDVTQTYSPTKSPIVAAQKSCGNQQVLCGIGCMPETGSCCPSQSQYCSDSNICKAENGVEKCFSQGGDQVSLAFPKKVESGGSSSDQGNLTPTLIIVAIVICLMVMAGFAYFATRRRMRPTSVKSPDESELLLRDINRSSVATTTPIILYPHSFTDDSHSLQTTNFSDDPDAPININSPRRSANLSVIPIDQRAYLAEEYGRSVSPANLSVRTVPSIDLISRASGSSSVPSPIFLAVQNQHSPVIRHYPDPMQPMQ
ncbi:hypothetical protein HK098_001616 [Nowakowskiella sp. JEL0407]|nr:hypothetical protein HK098_001616 [Nowakowskiella sp. JEL0407]